MLQIKRMLNTTRKNTCSHKILRKRVIFLVFILSFYTIGLFSNSLHIYITTAQEDNQQQQQNVMPPILDGIINPQEYDVENNISDNFVVYVSIVNQFAYFGLIGKTDGWISIGFEPESENTAMKGADIILGWVSENQSTYIVDAYADDVYDHKSDTELGGTFDIIAWNGKEVNGITTIEFVRLLNTTDQYDKAIPEGGTMFVMWAVGPNSADNAEDDHAADDQFRGFYTISLESGVEAPPPTEPKPKIDGGTFLLLHSVIGFLIGVFLYVFVYFPTVAIFARKDLQELIVKRKIREYPRIIEKPRVLESHSRD